MGTLSGSQVTALRSKNRENFSKVKPGEWIGFMQARQLVMIGDHHTRDAVNLYQDSTTKTRGKIKLIKAAKGNTKGEILVSAEGSKDAAEFESEFNDHIMKTKVTWQWKVVR
ncbi:MAG: hypothetical protein ACRD3O_00475 [Terriglobia bacterium]